MGKTFVSVEWEIGLRNVFHLLPSINMVITDYSRGKHSVKGGRGGLHCTELRCAGLWIVNMQCNTWNWSQRCVPSPRDFFLLSLTSPSLPQHFPHFKIDFQMFKVEVWTAQFLSKLHKYIWKSDVFLNQRRNLEVHSLEIIQTLDISNHLCFYWDSVTMRWEGGNWQIPKVWCWNVSRWQTPIYAHIVAT